MAVDRERELEAARQIVASLQIVRGEKAAPSERPQKLSLEFVRLIRDVTANERLFEELKAST